MGLCGEARITFDNGVRGPILLGRTRHFGGGLFAAIGE
jgi:CRISPR-associated protein Csb2